MSGGGGRPPNAKQTSVPALVFSAAQPPLESPPISTKEEAPRKIFLFGAAQPPNPLSPPKPSVKMILETRTLGLNHLLGNGSLAALWGARIPSHWHKWTQTTAAGASSLFYRWIPTVGVTHTASSRYGEARPTSNELATTKKVAFYGRSQALASRVRQTQRQKVASSGEVGRARAL